MKNIPLYARLIGTFLALAISLAHAEVDLRVSEQQLNSKLAQSFPFTLEYQGVKTTFRQPSIVLNMLEQQLEIKLLINAEFNQHQFIAQARFTGKMDYDVISDVLMFSDPQLEQFDGPPEPNQDQTSMIKIIKQSVVNNLPDLPLVDFTSLDIRYPKQAPNVINISANNIMLSF